VCRHLGGVSVPRHGGNRKKDRASGVETRRQVREQNGLQDDGVARQQEGKSGGD